MASLRLLRIVSYGIGFVIATMLTLAFFLIKDVPSIHEHEVSVCKGEDSLVTGKYLRFEQLPSNVQRLFKVAEPEFKISVVQIIETQMPPVRNLDRVLRGIILNVWIKQYSDRDLIEFYLNRAYFGEGCRGIDAAAKAYFKKDVSVLTLEETAKMLAIIKSPSAYSITEQPARNKERADILIEQLQGHSEGKTSD